jgi:flavorubredoxin
MGAGGAGGGSEELNRNPEATTLAAPPAVALVPGRLFLLGDSVAMDGRISWVPADATGWQPLNAYLLLEDGGAVIVDPGPAAHQAVVLRQLAALLPAGHTVSIYLTRAEPDVTGNLGEVARRYRVDKLFCGGGPNPFDAFEAVGAMTPISRGERVQMERTPAGYAVPVGGTRGVEVLRPIIRLLATYWGYDAATRTLFTSDSFGHHLQASPDGPRVLRDGALDRAAVRAHLLAKFGWLEHARTRSIVDNLRGMRRDRAIDRIAPGRGLVIEGAGLVARELDAMEQVLEELSS